MVLNASASLQTTLSGEVHLAERQSLLQERTLNLEKSLIYRAEAERPRVSKRTLQNLDPVKLE
jgi:hypothetical protein